MDSGFFKGSAAGYLASAKAVWERSGDVCLSVKRGSGEWHCGAGEIKRRREMKSTDECHDGLVFYCVLADGIDCLRNHLDLM